MSEQEVSDALRYRIEVDVFGSRKYHNSAGQLHRIDGPAIISERGVKYWYQNNRLHRTNGPAVEWNDSDEWWFINGERLSKGEFNLIVEQNV